MSRLRFMIVTAWSVFLMGCAVNGVYEDQDLIRTTLLDLYTNQILDNLIRAYNVQPIVQLDYTNATAQLTIKDTAGLSDMLVTSNPTVQKVIAGSTATVIKSTMNTAVSTLGVDRANQVALTATPLTAGDDVYKAYSDFLQIPGSLQISCTPPLCGAAIVCTRCGPNYCWVPTGYERAFLRLALATTAQRGQPAAALDAFYSVNIIGVLKAVGTDNAQTVTLVVKLDKPIPPDRGLIDISVAPIADESKVTNPASPAPAVSTPGAGSPGTGTGDQTGGNTDGTGNSAGNGNKKTLTFRVDAYDQPGQTKRPEQSDTIRLFYDVKAGKVAGFKSYNEFANNLKLQPVAAQIYLSRHRPQTPVENDPTSRIEFSLQQIQFNQIRLGSGP